MFEQDNSLVEIVYLLKALNFPCTGGTYQSANSFLIVCKQVTYRVPCLILLDSFKIHKHCSYQLNVFIQNHLLSECFGNMILSVTQVQYQTRSKIKTQSTQTQHFNIASRSHIEYIQTGLFSGFMTVIGHKNCLLTCLVLDNDLL